MLRLPKPTTYLITNGETTPATTSSSNDFQKLLELIQFAIAAKVDLIQLREKALTTRVLQQLVTRAAELTRGSATKLFVNDRADVAVAGGADGVHLTSQSLSASVVRHSFGRELLIGVSTHSIGEARAAQPDADFAVFGPVFSTSSKKKFGLPVGVDHLEEVCEALDPFPIIAIGGIDEGNAGACFLAGARGVAGISMFSDPNRIADVVSTIRCLTTEFEQKGPSVGNSD